MKIAIIDSGLDQEYHKKYFGEIKVKGYSIIYDNSSMEYGTDISDENGHGTTCFSVINRITPSAEYIVIKVCDDNGKTSSKIVTEALSSLVREDVQVICLALSVVKNDTDGYPEMESICRRLEQNGSVIVASYANNGQGSYPACFESVIGVSAASSLMKAGWIVRGNNIDIIEDVKTELISYKGEYRMFGNSLATAVVSGKVANILSNRHSGDYREELIQSYVFEYPRMIYNLTQQEKNFIEETTAIFINNGEKHIMDEAIMLYKRRYNKEIEYEKFLLSACNSLEDFCHQIFAGGNTK